MATPRVFCEGRKLSVSGLSGTLVCKGIEIKETDDDFENTATAHARNVVIQPQSAATESAPDPDTMQLLLDYGARQLKEQVESCRHVDTRIGVVLGFALIALAQGLTTAVRTTPAMVAVLRIHPWHFYTITNLLVVLLVGNLSTIGFGLWALQPRTVKALSIAEELKKVTTPPAEVIPRLLEGIEKGIQANREVQRSKIFRSRFAVGSIVMVFICYLFIAALMVSAMAR